MTVTSPPRNDFDLLDRLIVEALSDLRVARIGVARTGNRRNLDLLTRAEEHLDALLDYRHSAQRQ